MQISQEKKQVLKVLALFSSAYIHSVKNKKLRLMNLLEHFILLLILEVKI